MLYDIRMKETNAWVGQIEATDAEYAVWAFQDERDLPIGTLMTLVASPVTVDDMEEVYVDLYKSMYGSKPRDLLARSRGEGWTVVDWQDEIKKLQVAQ